MVIGLTGGIGAGKSLISKILQTLDYPVFNSDSEAKALVEKDGEIRKDIVKLVGESAYINGKYNRAYIAQIVFQDDEKLQKLNQIIHPAVRQLFLNFAKKQKNTLIFNEAAILFETGAYKTFDKTILVCADEELRLKRILERDQVKKEDVLARFAKQWTDEQKKPLADYLIYNNEKESVLLQLNAILKQLK